MTSPSHKRFEAIIRDTVENEEARKAAWEEAALKEELTQAVEIALREKAITPIGHESRRLAEIAVETLDEFVRDGLANGKLTKS